VAKDGGVQEGAWHLYLSTFLLSSYYFLPTTFLLSTRAHTSSLSLIGGTCAPLSVYFLTFLLPTTFLLSTRAHTSSLSLIGGTCAPLSVYFLTFLLSYFLTFHPRAHLLSLSYRGHLCTFVCLLSYVLTFFLSTCAHTSSLSLIGGTCAPSSVYFLTFLLSYFLTFLRSTCAHTSSLSLIGGTCAQIQGPYRDALCGRLCGAARQQFFSFDPFNSFAPPNALLVALRDGRRPLHPHRRVPSAPPPVHFF